MAKSKKRRDAAKVRRARKEEWKLMSPERRKEYNEHRLRTAKSGCAKRQRERARGVPMSDRSHEPPAWHSRPSAWSALQRGALTPMQCGRKGWRR